MTDRNYKLGGYGSSGDSNSSPGDLSDGSQGTVFRSPLAFGELMERLDRLCDAPAEPESVYLEEGILGDHDKHDYKLLPYAPRLGMYYLQEVGDDLCVPVRDPRERSGITLPRGYMRRLDSLPYREDLGLEYLEEVYVLLVVNEGRSPATANLRAPIIIKRGEEGGRLRGRQYIIPSRLGYRLRVPDRRGYRLRVPDRRGYRLREPVKNPFFMAVKEMDETEERHN